MHNWVAQRPDFKSAVRVVIMVLNTQCYQYLWLTMWFHAKKSRKKHSKTQNRWFYNVNSAPEPRNDQKSPKKRITKSRFTQFFVYVWYILDASRWILTSRRFRICVAKGGRGCLRPSYGRPKLTLVSVFVATAFAVSQKNNNLKLVVQEVWMSPWWFNFRPLGPKFQSVSFLRHLLIFRNTTDIFI